MVHPTASALARGKLEAVASKSATAPKEAASANSAVSGPAVATITPARAGPAAALTVNSMLSSAFPSRSSPCGVKTVAAAALVRVRPQAASVPASVANAITGGREKSVDSTARPAKAAACTTLSAGRLTRLWSDSRRATSGGVARAGAN